MDSDGTSENLQVSTASCKLMPQGESHFECGNLRIFALRYLNLNFIN